MTQRCAAESEPAWLKQERQAGERAQGGVGEISCFVEKGMRGMFEFVFYKESSGTWSVEKSISRSGGEPEGVMREAKVGAWRSMEMLFGATAREP